MKKIFAFLWLPYICFAALAQKKEFEGKAVYKVDIRSKIDGISDNAWRVLLATDNNLTIYAKKGNYRQVCALSDSYFITKDQKLYVKFKGRDTLYSLDYGYDTTEVTNI